MAAIDVTFISVFFLVFTLVYLCALAYVALLERRRRRVELGAHEHVFSLLVPARNEESVIGLCLDGLLTLDYPASMMEVLVIDDGSQDGTERVVSEYAAEHTGRIRAIRVPPAAAGRGKAAALNSGLNHLLETSPFRHNGNWIVGTFDADGRPDRDMLSKASYQFCDPEVGGVQATVRIRNRDASWLTRMQDIEFAGFARMTQIIRARVTHSASLGGNGQFVRAKALQDVSTDLPGRSTWKPDALTEDLDLATRLALRNWDIVQLNTSRVSQEGVETLRALLRQRTRWAWGSMQVFAEYVLKMRIVRTPKVRLRKRLDLLLNLSMFLVSPLVLITWILSGLALLGVASIASALPGPVLALLSFGYFPIVGYGLATSEGFRRRSLPLDLVGFALYTYHWVPCLYLGLWHLMAGHAPIWWKTPRSMRQPAG